jgi:hypothetical protein
MLFICSPRRKRCSKTLLTPPNVVVHPHGVGMKFVIRFGGVPLRLQGYQEPRKIERMCSIQGGQ